MQMAFVGLIWLAGLGLAGDDFDLHSNSVLSKVPAAAEAKRVERLSLAELLKAPRPLSDRSGCFLVVRTDQGNWAKLIVGHSLRKHGEELEPIVVIRRFQTLRSGSESGRLASGGNVYLFGGFQFDLDLGQIVPAGRGADLVFHKQGEGEGFLGGAESSQVYLVSRPLVSSGGAGAGGPSSGPVIPQDFSGVYQLVANGQWSARLSLHVTESGELSGSYVSDQTGGEYPVKGSVGSPGHQIRFVVELPAARQEFSGHLWTRGKNAIAGVMTLSGRPFGFVAVREGAELMPQQEEGSR